MTQMFNPPEKLPLKKEHDGWEDSVHVFDDTQRWAIRAALAYKRPLLVRGEPGTGKSQLARAAAEVLKRPFLYFGVTSATESHDLLWHFDSVGRLAEAQIYRDENQRDKLDPKRFLSPGPLWWALNWKTALKQIEESKSAEPMKPKKWSEIDGTVLLIDEIDKAEADVPNSLLECFGYSRFKLPYCEVTVEPQKDHQFPLVIVTTNEQRELPPAFVRRCLVLNLELPTNQDELKEFMIKRGHAHYYDTFKQDIDEKEIESLFNDTAAMLVKYRVIISKKGFPLPGQAEYLDLLEAVLEIKKQSPEKSINDLLKTLKGFAFSKWPKIGELPELEENHA